MTLVFHKGFSALRYSAFIHQRESFNAVVLEGALASKGMSSFSDKNSADEVGALRAYIIHRANVKTPNDPSHALKQVS
ncbi:hypothetical protein [Thalassotalea sp. PLHSN55]|uniref:hypothetical protein n=1 Tax=Thalassotalea sp. PLHSN55 TaxID=3435888 RepID=UPI003F82B779